MLSGLGDGKFSKSSNSDLTAEEVAKLEESAKQKKEQDKKDKTDKKPKKQFEPLAALSTLQPELEEWARKMIQRSEDVLGKARALIDEVNSEVSMREAFTVAFNLLQFRYNVACQAFWVHGTSESGQPQAIRKDEHIVAWKEYLTENEKMKDLATTESLEPYAKVNEMSCASDVLWQLGNVDITCKDDIKNEKTRLRDVIACYGGLTTRVAEQMSRLKHFVRKRSENIAKEQDKLKKEASEEQKRAVAKAGAKARAAAKPKAKSSERTHTIHDHRPRFAEAGMKTVCECESIESFCTMPMPVREPVMIRDPQWMLSNKLADALNNFLETEFRNSPNALKYQRGSKVCLVEVKSLLELRSTLWKDGAEVEKNLSSAESHYLSSAWMFAMTGQMVACAPEFSFLTRIKVTFKGTRSIVCVHFHELAAWHLTLMKSQGKECSGHVTVQAACDSLSEIDSYEALQDAVSHMPSMRFCTVPAASVVVVPWGHVVAERTLNQEEVVGIRFMAASDVGHEEITTLAAHILPSDGKAKIGSAGQFLLRCLCAGGGKAGESSASVSASSKGPGAVKLEIGAIMQTRINYAPSESKMLALKKTPANASAATEPALKRLKAEG